MRKSGSQKVLILAYFSGIFYAVLSRISSDLVLWWESYLVLSISFVFLITCPKRGTFFSFKKQAAGKNSNATILLDL